MLPALLLVPLVALFRVWLAWLPLGSPGGEWLLGCSPVAAVAVCGGLFLPRRLALAIPLGILLCSDAIIDVHYHAQFFSGATLANYALLAALVLGGTALRRRLTLAPGFPATLAAALAGTLFFYAASNTLAWAGSASYPQTLAGLWQSLTVGLPGYPPSCVFLRNELVSDALYSMVFVACVRLTAPAPGAAAALARAAV